MRLCQSTRRSLQGRRWRAPAFRKTCLSRFHSHVPQSQPVAKSTETCFEGPFGEVIRATGPLANTNPFRFSTKYQDDETDLLYYGYRYYSASAGRWLNQDPIGKPSDFNLYAFTRNSALSYVDLWGLLTWINNQNVSLWGAEVHWPRGSDFYNNVPADGAITVPRVSMKFSCCKCGWFSWRLCKEGITIDYHAETTFSPGIRSDPAAKQEWMARAEGDHVADFNEWASKSANPLAQSTEDSLRPRSWLTAQGCGFAIRDAMFEALLPSARTAIEQSVAKWDDTGRHTWGSPTQRP